MHGFTPNSRRDGLIDCSPTCDVHRANMIGIIGEPARCANKLRLASATSLVDDTTRETGARGIAGIDGNNLHTGEPSLVFDKRPKLIKRPSAVHRSLASLNSCPLADTSKVFQGDPSRGVFGLCDDTLCDGMVHVGTETGLLARESLEMTLGRLGTDGLQGGTQPRMTLADSFNDCSTMPFTVGVYGKISDPKINPKPVGWFNGRTVGNLDGNVEEELSVAVDEISLTAHAFQTSTVVISDDNRQNHSPVEGGDAYTIDTVLEGVETLVESDCTVRLEGDALGFVPLVNLADLRNYADGVLRVQTESLSKRVVVEVLEFEFVGCAKFERSLGKPVTRGIDAFQRGKQKQLLLVGHDQLACGYEFHAYKRNTSKPNVNQETRQRFLPRLKARASMLEIR